MTQKDDILKEYFKARTKKAIATRIANAGGEEAYRKQLSEAGKQSVEVRRAKFGNLGKFLKNKQVDKHGS